MILTGDLRNNGAAFIGLSRLQRERLEGPISRALLRLTSRRTKSPTPAPLLIELLHGPPKDTTISYKEFPFSYGISRGANGPEYNVSHCLTPECVREVREVVSDVSRSLDPSMVEPLTFETLVEVLRQLAAEGIASGSSADRVKELSELVAYEAIGLSRILALAKDSLVSEFFVDSDLTAVYLDHSKVGRCETDIVFTDRERRALETHLDTFRGYTLDYATPSLKNDLEVGGARLRVSLDLDPISVNRFSLDVRRLNLDSLSLVELVGMGVVSAEAAAFLTAWLELGGNVTIIGETGTGKTTLLNALDEALNPKLRRVYIEDAVETKDLLGLGYHQVKIKVDPFDRNEHMSRTKETEIIKVLHRSPDIVILSEIQSGDHSRAFFHALSAGIRGIQTFHASSIEQAVRRWTNVHAVPKQSLLDLGVLVQMQRPDRLKPFRIARRVCEIVGENGEPRLRDIYDRDRTFVLRRVTEWDRVSPPEGKSRDDLVSRIERHTSLYEEPLISS